MSIEKQKSEDEQVEMALRHFRESVHAWSESEFVKPRVVGSSRWQRMFRVLARPMFSGVMAGVLLMAGAGIPLAVQHEHQVAAAQEAAKQEQQRLRVEEAKRQAALAMNDEELMSHLDSDLAQAAPDAMEPLASLMSNPQDR